MTRKNAFMLLFVLGVATTAAAQFTEPPPVPLPSLSIEGSRLDSTVTYDPARRVYRYAYTIVAAPTNKAKIAASTLM